MREVEIAPTFEDWRQAARELLLHDIPPDEVVWVDASSHDPSRLDFDKTARPSPGGPKSPLISVPKSFVDLARRVAEHHDPARWSILYRLLWRLVHENRDLLRVATDPDVAAAARMGRSATQGAEGPSAMGQPPQLEPDAAIAAAFLPTDLSLPALREAAARCTGCALYKTATQTVFGMGPTEARVMFIGEQPGDQEDLAGAPFVGPAGEVLTRALAEVGIWRHEVYITNAVKHFKWEPRGKRRIHMTPRLQEIQACRPWLEAEIETIKPSMIVCLGATAAQSLMGPQFRVMRNRGRAFQTRWAPWLMATIHPSAILRIDDPAAQEQAYADLVADLRIVAVRLEEERRSKTLGELPPAAEK